MAENTEQVVQVEETEKKEAVEKTVKTAKKAKTEKVKKPSWFKGLKAEFKKIIWPDKKTLVKQTVAVIACSLALGIIIAVIDWLIQFGLKFLV